MSRLARFAINVLSVVTGLLLFLAIYSTFSDPVDNEDIYVRQEMILDQLEYISCLHLIAELTPEAVAACQVPSEQ